MQNKSFELYLWLNAKHNPLMEAHKFWNISLFIRKQHFVCLFQVFMSLHDDSAKTSVNNTE